MRFRPITADDARKIVFEASLLEEAASEVFDLIVGNAKNKKFRIHIKEATLNEETNPRLKTIFKRIETNPESLDFLVETIQGQKFKCQKYEEEHYVDSKFVKRPVIEIDWSINKEES